MLMQTDEDYDYDELISNSDEVMESANKAVEKSKNISKEKEDLKEEISTKNRNISQESCAGIDESLLSIYANGAGGTIAGENDKFIWDNEDKKKSRGNLSFTLGTHLTRGFDREYSALNEKQKKLFLSNIKTSVSPDLTDKVAELLYWGSQKYYFRTFRNCGLIEEQKLSDKMLSFFTNLITPSKKHYFRNPNASESKNFKPLFFSAKIVELDELIDEAVDNFCVNKEIRPRNSNSL